MAKTRLLLLDADVVLTAHELGIWEQLKVKYEIAVPATIIREARYFKSQTGNKSINLQIQIDAGEISCLEATAGELLAAFNNFTNSFLAGIDDGEKEGIALIHCGRAPGYAFCTGDTNAIEAIGMLDLGNSSISFEEVALGAGLGIKSVRPSMGRKAHAEHVKKGRDRRISGECFIKSPLI